MMMRCLSLFLVLGAGTALLGQTFTGTVTGRISDPNEAVVPAADVVLQNANTGEIRRGKTNESGIYTFPQLLPGSYTLSVSKEGFRGFVQNGVQLGTNQTAVINARLVLGQVSEKIEITAAPPLIDTQTSNQSFTLETRLVQELPLLVRNPFALVHANAGTVALNPNFAAATGDQNTTRFSLNGGRENSAQIMIDGVPALAGDWGGLLTTPAVDTVQEVQVLRNTYEAQYGKSGGGVVNMTTKGGGHQVHGSLFEYLANDNLNANDFWNNKFGRTKSESKTNQFGGNLSGPIWNSKRLYGLFGYEGLRQNSPASRLATVPTEMERGGDFSQSFNSDRSLRQIFDPLSTRLDAGSNRYLRDPFAGNRIAASRFDPVALNILKYMPAANQPGQAPTNISNFYGVGSSNVVNNRYDMRIDWARTDWHSIWGRLTAARQRLRPYQFWAPSAEVSQDQINPRYHVNLGNTFVASPTLVINVLLGGGRWNEQQRSKGYGFDYGTLGYPDSLVGQFDVPTPPEVSIGTLTMGYPRELGAIRNVFNAQLNVSKDLSSHSLKFGYSMDAALMNQVNAFSSFFAFNNGFTLGPDADSQDPRTGSGMASLLLGVGASGRAPKADRPAVNDKSWALYFQDNWKVSRRLAFNYGVRYEVQEGRTERNNHLNYFDFDAESSLRAATGLPGLRGGLRFLDAGNRNAWNTTYNNIAPRIAIAYKVTDRLVARAGYGIFYLKNVSSGPPASTTGYTFDTPWVTSVDGGRTPSAYLRNPFPSGIAQPPGAAAGLLTAVGQAVSAFEKSRPTPYMQQYSLDVQYQLSNTAMFELGYSGSQGRKLSYGFAFQRNQLPDAELARGNALLGLVNNPFFGVITGGALSARTVQLGQLLRPFPQFTGVTTVDSPGASSSFNALTGAFTKRFSSGLNVIASYRFSKAIDNASESISFGTGDRGRNFNNTSLDRSISAHDIPHSLAVTYLYELPLGTGRRFGGALHPLLDGFVGGWSLSGIFKMDSGFPLNFTAPNNSNSFGGGQYPNISDRKQLKLAEPTIERWFNTSVFSQPAPFTFGNTPRWVGEVRSGRNNNMDLALMKSFRMREKLRLQLRGEFFNAFNRNRFAAPNRTLGNNAFGQVLSSINGPREIQLALRATF
jgi:hypothetical protein